MPRQAPSPRRPAPRTRRWQYGLVGLLLLTTLAGCQIGPGAPTPAPVATAAAPTAPASVAPTAAPTAAAPTVPAPMGTVAAGTATRAAGTPGVAASPGGGAVCAFEPPFGRATGAPTPVSTPRASPPPARPGQVAAPGQTPPTIPLPDLAAAYTLVVDQFDFAEGRLRTAQTVRVTNREGCALDRLFFSVTAARWGWFALDGLRVDGQGVAAALDGTVLPVRLPRPLAPGATTEIAIDFRLDVGVAADPYTPGGFAGTTQAGDILRLAYWFPILSDDHQYPPYLDPPYTATADFAVTLTTPAEIVVAPTGTITAERRNGDGTVTRQIAAPNVRDFVMALSPNYQVARRQSATGVLVEVYYSPQSFRGVGFRPEAIQQQVAKALDDAVFAEEQLSRLIGQYPYPVLRVVDASPQLSGGIEFPMLVMVNLTLGSRNLIYHEVGHEWFYGLIGTRTQQDPWIDEGGATFLADYLAGTLAQNPPPPGDFTYDLDIAVWEVQAGGFQRNATRAIYDQGGAFYTLVLRQMGEEAFWSALQRLYGEKRYGIITPRDLLAAWQAASPVDLRPLFAEYLEYPWIGELGR